MIRSHLSRLTSPPPLAVALGLSLASMAASCSSDDAQDGDRPDGGGEVDGSSIGPDAAPSPDAMASGDATAGADAQELAHWTEGHGDLTFKLQNGGVVANWNLDGATVDGNAGVSGDFALSTVAPFSTARFTRPVGDGGAFDALCVAGGETTLWLPQNNRDASDAAAPFLGIANDVPNGTLVGDELTLALSDVQSPSGSGTYALWRDGFPPRFFMSSCEGVTGVTNTMAIPSGHDHFNMGFSEPGEWVLTYRVTGQLEGTGQDVASDLTVRYLLE